MRSFLILAFLLGLTACTDPFISIPGGQLSGSQAAAPVAWSSAPDVIQLEVRPDDPYSINIWAVANEGNLYVATVEAQWASYIAQDGRVRVRADSTVFELEAQLVADDDELQKVAKTYTSKYEVDENDNWVSSAKVYRLVGR